MHRLQLSRSGASVLDEDGRTLFSGTLEECENFLDWSENTRPAPTPRPVPAVRAPAFVRQLFGPRAVTLPRQPR